MVVEDNTKINTSINILDTGKYSLTSTVQSGEKIAFGSDGVAGSKLLLKGIEINVNFTTMSSSDGDVLRKKNDTSTEAFDYGEADQNGIELPKWTLSGIFSRNNVEDLKTLGRLIYMTKTKGYKELYAPLDTDRKDMFSYSKYGEREADGESIKTVDFINIRIKGFTCKQTSDNKHIKWSLVLVETN